MITKITITGKATTSFLFFNNFFIRTRKSIQDTINTVCLQRLFQIEVKMSDFLVKYRQIASSANGRPIGSEPINCGSNPCEATDFQSRGFQGWRGPRGV